MKKLTLITAVILALLLGACGPKTDSPENGSADEVMTLKITMIGKSGENPVFDSAREGAESAARRMTEKHRGLELLLDWQTPSQESAAKQAESVRRAADTGSAGILVSCSDDSLLTEAIDYAVSRGSAVITFDSDAAGSKRFSFIGADEAELGRKVMSAAIERLGGSGQIAILAGNAEAPNLRERVEAMMAVLEEHPLIELAGVFHHAETGPEALAVMETVNADYPELDAWAMAGGWPFFTEDLMSRLEAGKYTIVAVDAIPEMLQYVESGHVQLLWGQPSYSWGSKGIEAMVDSLYLKKSVSESIEHSVIPVSIDNLGGWSRQLRAWGFRGLPEKYLTM